MAGRGELTEAIKKLSLKLMDYEISVKELRLMPYLSYCLVNDGIDPKKINAEEQDIINKWIEEGFLENHNQGINSSHSFWITMQEIIYLGYVAYKDQ